MVQRKQHGFTIIEVVLVLAIAGLIFLMVFIALPALQKSQKDTQRRQDLSRLQTAINNYQTNNKGNLPDFSTEPTVTAFLNSYLKTAGETFTDPNGTDYIVGTGTLPGTFDGANPYIKATKGAICGNDEGTVTTGQGSRKIALQMRLEGSGVACINN